MGGPLSPAATCSVTHFFSSCRLQSWLCLIVDGVALFNCLNFLSILP